MSAQVDIQPGHRIGGKFEVVRVLGRGGMGVVVLARHLVLDEHVAIKMLTGKIEKIELARFVREAKSMMRIKSEHVVRVLDVATDGDTPYMVMEHLEGQDLDHVVGARGPLPVAEAVDDVLQACEAVAEAHALGIVHRDLKPANMFATRRADGTSLIKVLDFGISKVVDGDGQALTSTSAVLGTPLFMSPEQMRRTTWVNETTDIWSIGVVLYHLLSGSFPFMGSTVPEVCAMILGDPPVPLRDRRGDVPPELEAVVLRCLDKNPQSRFATIAALAEALAPFSPASHLSVERIARVTGTRAPLPSLPSLGPDNTGSRRVVLPVSSTAGSFTRTQRAEGHQLVPMLAIGGAVMAVVVVVLALVAVFAIRGSHGSKTSASSPVTSESVVVSPAAPSSSPKVTPSVAPSASAAPSVAASASVTSPAVTARPRSSAPTRKYGGRQ